MIVQEGDHKDSFYKSFRPVLILGQMCGLIPLRGIFGPRHTRLRFTWLNPMFVYSGVIFGMASFFAYSQTLEIMKNEIKMDRMAPAIFYSVVLLAIFMFFSLAKKFPEVVSDFSELERNMEEYGYPKRIGLKILIFIIVATSLALVEHGTFVFLIGKRAERLAAATNISFGHAFFLCMFREVSFLISYNPFGIVIMFWVNMICTLSWSYIDFFLIAISIEVSSRLNQINNRISTIDLKEENQSLWRKVSEDYNRMSILIKKLDNFLSSIIVTSFLNNLYHVALQLLRSLTIGGTIFQKCYFYSSLVFLIGRLLSVLFCASQIEAESKKSLDLLYCIEVPCQGSNRLLQQIVTDNVCFTGKRFFTINYKFLITLVGTLITYEVILLQVNSLYYFSD